MSRWLLIIIMIGFVLVVAAALLPPMFMPQTTFPVPTRTPILATPPPANRVEEEKAGPQALDHLPTLTDLRQSLQLHLTAEWQTTWLSAAALGQLLYPATVDQSTGRQEAVTTLRHSLANETMLLSGSYHASGSRAERATLLIFAVPRNGVSLERYLQDVEEQLAVQGAQTAEAIISAEYRTDRLPVGLLHYVLPGQQPTVAQVSGIQLVTMDRSADRLIVFTITTSAEDTTDLDARIREVMRGSIL
jgi:hypothetical protein